MESNKSLARYILFEEYGKYLMSACLMFPRGSHESGGKSLERGRAIKQKEVVDCGEPCNKGSSTEKGQIPREQVHTGAHKHSQISPPRAPPFIKSPSAKPHILHFPLRTRILDGIKRKGKTNSQARIGSFRRWYRQNAQAATLLKEPQIIQFSLPYQQETFSLPTKNTVSLL